MIEKHLIDTYWRIVDDWAMPPDSSLPKKHETPSGPDFQQPPGDTQESNDLNFFVVTFLGLALLVLVITIAVFTLDDSGKTLPDGLISLITLIAGGLLAVLNPARGVRAMGGLRRRKAKRSTSKAPATEAASK
jgi:hypothetical protein